MKKRAFGPGALIAGGLALVAGAYLLFRNDDEDQQATKEPSGDKPVPPNCPASTFWSASDSRCVPLGTPPVAAANDGLVPYPPHPRILFFGGEIALHTAEALSFILGNAEKSTGLPLGPSNTAVWSGQGIAQIEAFASSIDASIPQEILAAPPDLAIVMVGEWNAKWGPADSGTQSAIATIVAKLVHLLPSSRTGSPIPATNIILVKPWQKALPHTFELLPLFDSVALGALGRAFPFMPKGSEIPLADDNMTPTSEGYAALARQIASLLVRKIDAPKTDTAFICPTGWLRYADSCVPDPNACPAGMTPDGAGGCTLENPSEWKNP